MLTRLRRESMPPTRPDLSRSMVTDETTPGNQTPADAGPSPLRSVHTTSFPAILDQLGSSLLVTTYQAGKLVVVRSDGGVINTHFRAFNKPMGMAVGPRAARDRHGGGRLGVSQRAGGRGQARSARQARCLLSCRDRPT